MNRRPEPQRRGTYPLHFSSRRKPRRWPLVLRFVKGAVHQDVAIPIILHALFAALIVFLDKDSPLSFHLPTAMIPSLSIVMGLILVFRNSTSYDRFWQGQLALTSICTSVRNLTRSFLSCSYASNKPLTDAERADVERTIRTLLAFAYAVKNHLRHEWDAVFPSLTLGKPSPLARLLSQEADPNEPAEDAQIDELLPSGVETFQDHGLGLPQQLSIQVETFIKRGHDRGWFHAPQASQLTVQLNSAIEAFGRMETIRLTPLPVAYLIHIRQILALFGCVLPFAMVSEMGWWTILVVTLVTFTLYGVEAISAQLEDPFGYDKNDIKMDAVIEDLRVEVMVMLDQWKRGGSMFPAQRTAS